MRKGMQGLALLVQESLGRDPFAGDVFVFRGRAGQQATFYMQLSFCGDRLSVAPAVQANPAGIAIPARQGFDVHLHG
ncbi:transposase [Bradyrhizobium sp. GM6.1]